MFGLSVYMFRERALCYYSCLEWIKRHAVYYIKPSLSCQSFEETDEFPVQRYSSYLLKNVQFNHL